ncbi:MAG: UDP-N-acetylglucosamine 1-carboxyvinyltransferase [Dehalococcoidia bacterium]|nr:UDP-N-acetylglucosamine 1-carboxyvinyltransferase [Dehalococcoidia bacterium]
MVKVNSEELVIQGGEKLDGTIAINGSKNAALYAIAASLLTEDEVTYYNVPEISDVLSMKQILQSLGAKIDITSEYVKICSADVDKVSLSKDLSVKLRASILILAPLLARHGLAECFLPGGDDIGERPIDIHIDGLNKLGAKVEIEGNKLVASVDRFLANKIVFDYPSVLGTINLLFAACLATGETQLENVATEPEVLMLIEMLNNMGADIQGGGSQTLLIHGVQELHGTEIKVIPDRIEAGTLMMCIAVTNGKGHLTNLAYDHMGSIIEKLRDANIHIIEEDDSLIIDASNKITPVNVQSVPYPGFPTDLQAPVATLLTQASGLSVIHERVFDNRLLYIKEINLMGANIQIDNQKIYINGPSILEGKNIRALDVRAGAAAIIAGLVAKGETRISALHHIDRGYSNIDFQLKTLGANITRMDIRS